MSLTALRLISSWSRRFSSTNSKTFNFSVWVSSWHKQQDNALKTCLVHIFEVGANYKLECICFRFQAVAWAQLGCAEGWRSPRELASHELETRNRTPDCPPFALDVRTQHPLRPLPYSEEENELYILQTRVTYKLASSIANPSRCKK